MIRIYLCILFSLLYTSAEASELIKVARVDNKDIIQLYFSFTQTPKFSSSDNDRRIDLEFENTTSAASLSFGQPDERIVKILPRPSGDRYILSLFFRYRPQQYKLTESPDGKLVFEVLLGNEFSKSYQNLADSLQGITVLDRGIFDDSNPYLITPYVKDWMSFFSQYESPVKINVGVTFHSPPFPIIALLPPGKEENLQLLDEEMIALAEQNLWDHLAEKLLTAIENNKDLEAKKLLALTYGEALARAGNFENSYKQLYLLKDYYSQELLGIYATYLLINLRSKYEDPYIADNEYRLLSPSLKTTLPLAPYLILSQIETALATSNIKSLNKLLQRDDVAYPPEVAEQVRVRQADYWYAIDHPIKAKAAYKLLEDSPLLQTMPYSLQGACSVYYDQRKFTEAARCYSTLSNLIEDKNTLGLIEYKMNMARLKTTPQSQLIDEFSHIENVFPDTDAGYRAAIKKNDILFLQTKAWGKQAIQNYGEIAEKSSSRPIRAEALFKQALVQSILGNRTEAIKQLQNFLRNFLTSDVRIPAQALLIQLLPEEINSLVKNHEYMRPLVLAKQNKLFFENRWIDPSMLVDIAKAYHKIGIFDEAQKLYLYLISIMPVELKEAFFLPMIQATFDHGNFSLVEDYAAQYNYTYPDGRYKDQILHLYLQSLVADERISDAVSLFPNQLPEYLPTCELALSLFYRIDNFEKCIEITEKLSELKKSLSDKEQFIYAESSYRLSMGNQANKAFSEISEESRYYQQALYRLAELARENGNEKKALSLFEKIVETEKNSLWKQYAERELQFAKTAARM